MISSRENLRESTYQPDSGFDWEGQTWSLQDGSVHTAFLRMVVKTTLVQVISSEALPVSGPAEASRKSLHAAPLKGIDGSLSWGECLGSRRIVTTPLSVLLAISRPVP